MYPTKQARGNKKKTKKNLGRNQAQSESQFSSG